MANVRGNVMDMLDMLQFGDPGEVNSAGTRYTKTPNFNPGSDPRAQAIDRYMQMQGSGGTALPNHGFGFAMPNDFRDQYQGKSASGTRQGTPDERQGAVEGMARGSEEDGLADTNAYFPDAEKDYNSDDIDAELSKEINPDIRDEWERDRRKPSYTTGKGQPSPDENYNDEDLLAKLAKRLGGR